MSRRESRRILEAGKEHLQDQVLEMVDHFPTLFRGCLESPVGFFPLESLKWQVDIVRVVNSHAVFTQL